MPIFLSVTIATFNRVDLLEKVLCALIAQTLDSAFFEIIICDSHSSDGTAQMVDSCIRGNPTIKIRHLHTKNILAAKRNLGINAACGEIVVFLDDDCIPEPTWLETYYDIFKADSDKSHVYCGEVRFPREWIVRSNYYRYRDSRHFIAREEELLRTLTYKTIVVMNMAFRKDEFVAKIGCVNEKFVGYGCEDQELGWRLQAKGFKLYPCKALIIHYEGSSTISGYCKKIFYTARDGARTLLSVEPNAFKGMSKLRFIDRDYPSFSPFRRCLYAILRRAIFYRVFARGIEQMLIFTDRCSRFYCPAAFRYVLACSYIDGVRARPKDRSLRSDATNWYV